MQQELCDDLMAMIACFSGRLYGTRAKQNFDRDRERKGKKTTPEV
jgi:predicted site-specific integrase-resolvase